MEMGALNDLEKLIEDEPNIPHEVKEQLSGKVTMVKLQNPKDTDKIIYRIVVGSLGLAILACLTFTFIITLKNTDPKVSMDIPEIFMAIGSAAVGALAGLLAPSPGRGGN